MRIFLLTLVTAMLGVAADLTGTWSGTIEFKSPDGETRTRSAHMVLKQDGNTVTGTGGPDADRQHPMREGKIDGSKVTFIVDDNSTAIHFNLVVDGDTLKGELKSEREGQAISGRLDLKRAK